MNGDLAKYETGKRCRYLLPRKKRNCRLQALKDSDYCVEHNHLGNKDSVNGNSISTRILCPLDPSHTCDSDKLQKHLKKCNATKIVPKDPWYELDINNETSIDVDLVSSLREASSEECKWLILKIKKLKLEEIEQCSETLYHDALSEEIEQCKDSAKALRQLKQNSGLLSLLDNAGLLLFPGSFVEFGAGRGQLTTSVFKARNPGKVGKASYILVDRGTNRRKMDAKHRQQDGTEMKRIRVDIKDLSLGKIDLIAENPCRPLVAISKHLCGVATDLTLKCLISTVTEPVSVQGGVIALCCHHRCTWSNYCNKDYFLTRNFTAREFSIVARMSSWAVCHFCPKTDNLKGDKGLGQNEDYDKFDFLSNEEKEQIGKLCKTVIDFGRKEFLTQNGFQCKLVEYTTKNVSLENVALLFNM